MLFAPASCTVNKYPDADNDGDDKTNHLVTVIPKGAKVKVTNLEGIIADHDADDSGDHYTDHDLRRDILIHCHDNADHPSFADTSNRVRALAWFPKMKSYIQGHVDTCTYCLAKSKASTPVGIAVRAQRRLKLIEIDHKIVPVDIAKVIGCSAILTIVDVVSRVTVFVPVPSKGAVDTARAIFTRWYPMFGVPAIIRRDGAAEFSSDVMKAFCDLMGVKHNDISAPDDPTHHAVVERRNRVMEKFLDVAISKGDLNKGSDLDLYCAAATAACNLEYTQNNYTVLEYLTGEVPRTHRDMVTIMNGPLPKDELNAQFITQLREVLQESNSIMKWCRDDDARYHAMERDVAQHRKQATKFTLIPGDKVSFRGEAYNLHSISESTSTDPVKAVIRKISHDAVTDKTVRYDDLRPVADPRPVLMRTNVGREPPESGKFVFFKVADTSEVLAGIVTGSDHETVTIHEFRQSGAIQRRFYAMYTNTQNGKEEAKLKPHAHHEPISHRAYHDDILIEGEIENNHIPISLLDAMISMGVAAE